MKHTTLNNSRRKALKSLGILAIGAISLPNISLSGELVNKPIEPKPTPKRKIGKYIQYYVGD